MQPLSLFTIGYETRRVEDFVDELRRSRISTLVDVREVPLSRKAGFSKNKLRKYLEEFNIKYVHIKELGSPKLLRQKLYKDNDYNHFFKEYRKHIRRQIHTVKNLYRDAVSHGFACLMCMEKDYSICHRKIVAEKIKVIDGNGLIIKHL